MGTESTARMKKEHVWNRINEQSAVGLGYKEELLVGELILSLNSTTRTVKEYINAFVICKKVFKKEGMLYSALFFNEDLSIKEQKVEQEGSGEGILTPEEAKAFEQM